MDSGAGLDFHVSLTAMIIVITNIYEYNSDFTFKMRNVLSPPFSSITNNLGTIPWFEVVIAIFGSLIKMILETLLFKCKSNVEEASFPMTPSDFGLSMWAKAKRLFK